MPSIAPLDSAETEFGHVEWAGFINDVPIFASVEGQCHLLLDRHVVVHSPYRVIGSRACI